MTLIGEVERNKYRNFSISNMVLLPYYSILLKLKLLPTLDNTIIELRCILSVILVIWLRSTLLTA